MKIAFVYLPGRINRLNVAGGEEGIARLPDTVHYHPTDFFYGAFEMRDKGHTVGLFETIERPRRSIPKYLAEKLLKGKYLPVKTYPATIDAVWFLLDSLKNFDVVVGTTPGIAFSLAFWSSFRKFNRPIVGIQCGILNYSFNPIRIRVTRALLNKMFSQLYGVGELNAIQEIYGADPNRIEVNCFGVDTKFWKPSANRSDDRYILAVGNDASRDFDTLIRAARQINQRLIIVTKRQLPDPLPDNVTQIQGTWKTQELDDNEIRHLYQKSIAVAVPLLPVLQPSGQSVALQGMACGKPVILTKTKGLWENDQLKDMQNILFVSPKDTGDWKQKIQLVNNDQGLMQRIGESARQYALNHGNISQFAERIERMCLKAVKEKSIY